jgi:hypothetical protein
MSQCTARAGWVAIRLVCCRGWLALCGLSPWPDAGMGPGLRAACSPRAPLASSAEASASALIRAPIGQVWQAVSAPESTLLIDPGHGVCAGRVPGTPAGQVGEMQYFVRRDDDGRLGATAGVVTELTRPAQRPDRRHRSAAC